MYKFSQLSVHHHHHHHIHTYIPTCLGGRCICLDTRYEWNPIAFYVHTYIHTYKRYYAPRYLLYISSQKRGDGARVPSRDNKGPTKKKREKVFGSMTILPKRFDIYRYCCCICNSSLGRRNKTREKKILKSLVIPPRSFSP